MTREARALPEHIPALDGVRGVAILMVMVLHLGSSEVDDGLGASGLLAKIWVRLADQAGAGVDLFFVLSGFLITRILLRNKGDQDYLRNFYMRRVLRIFPLYYGTLLVILMIYIPFLAPEHPVLERYREHQTWLWLYLPNVATAFFGIVWKGGPVNLDHFWSLAVEEHFYLAWPFLVLLLSRRALLVTCGALIAAAVVAKVLFLRAGLVDATYQLTISRMDGLAMGAALAVVVARTGDVTPLRGWNRALIAVSTIGLVWVGTADDSLWWTTALTHTVWCAFFLGVLILVLDGGLVSRAFDNPVLRFFGRLSYGLYVFHAVLRPAFMTWFPVERLQAAVGSRMGGVLVFLVLTSGITCVLALGSWHFFEKRFLALKALFQPRRRPVG